MARINTKNAMGFLQPVQKTINTATQTAATLVNTANRAINTAQNVVNTAVNTVNRAVSTAQNVVNTAVATASAIKNTATQAADLIKKYANGQTVSSILSVPANIATSIFEKTSSFFKDSDKKNHTSLGNHATSVAKTISQFADSCKNATATLNGNNSGNLQKDGLFFRASTTTKAIDGISLPGADKLQSFVNMGAGQLGKLASMGKEALSSVSNGLKAVTSTVSDLYNKGKSALNTVTQTVGSVVSSVTRPISQVMNFASAVTDPRLYGGIVAENLKDLPFGLGNMIGNKVTNAVGSVIGGVNDKINNYASKVNAINGIATGLSVEGLFGTVSSYSNGLGSSSRSNSSLSAASLSGVGGSWIPGVSSFQGTSTQYTSLADSISVLCNDQSLKTSYQTYGENKDVFDMILQGLLSTRAGAALQALLNCGGNSSYIDGRSRNIVRNNVSTITSAGDTFSYKTILDSFSKDVIADEKKDYLTLSLNAKGNESTKQDMSVIAAGLGINKSDAITNAAPIGSHKVYDAAKITAMQLADKEFQDEDLSREDIAAVNAALLHYGPTATGQALAY